MLGINEILLRRKNKILIETEVNESLPIINYPRLGIDKSSLIIAGIKNIESFGYTVTVELLKELLENYTEKDFMEIYSNLIHKLKLLKGADVEYKPMYPNFPEQVENASDGELFFNAILHYLTFGEWIPEYKKEEKLPLLDPTIFKVLDIGEEKDLIEIFVNLVNSKTGLSEQDKKDIEEIISKYPESCMNCLPDEIALKENVSLVFKILIEKSIIPENEILKKYFKTATDVLRLATALSDGDISLNENTKYKKFIRAERRFLMQLLSNCGNITEDMFRYKNRWIRLGEIIHPGEFKAERYKKVNRAFELLRNNDKPEMFGRKIHNLLVGKETKKAVELLCERPGEFARNLDKVLRDAKDKEYVIDSFKSVACDVSTSVLLQTRQHFINRNNPGISRVVFPKGNVAKAIVLDNNVLNIEDKYCEMVYEVCTDAIIKNYIKREPLGKVYIDKDLKNYITPFSQRSVNSSSRNVTRGSKLPVKENTSVLRSFIWWTNFYENDGYESSVDLDLSAAYFDKDWNYIQHISYTNLRSKKVLAYHSGDIVDGGKPGGEGVAEFIDTNIAELGDNIRYIVYQVYSFSRQPFVKVPCRFGYMEREIVNSGELFEPRTVEMKIELNQSSTVAIPMIYDRVKNKMIWCDMNIGIEKLRTNFGGNNFESNSEYIKKICNAIVNMNKINLYDFIELFSKARGTIVEDRDKADIIFSNDLTRPTIEIIKTDETGNEIKELKENTDVKIITAFDLDYYYANL